MQAPVSLAHSWNAPKGSCYYYYNSHGDRRDGSQSNPMTPDPCLICFPNIANTFISVKHIRVLRLISSDNDWRVRGDRGIRKYMCISLFIHVNVCLYICLIVAFREVDTDTQAEPGSKLHRNCSLPFTSRCLEIATLGIG